MRILLVNGHGADLTYAGAERYVHDLREGLRGRGHEVTVLSAFPVRDGSSAETVVLHDTDWREDRVRRVRNHLDDWIAAPWPSLEPVLAELAPDLIHTSNLPGITTGLWEVARRRGVPVVHTLHDYQLLCPRTSLIQRDGSPCRPHPLLCGLRTRRLARWSDGVRVVIGVSSHVLGRHVGFFGPATERRVIRHPLPAPLGDGSAPDRPPAVLGFIGRLVPYKGVELLLEAAPRLVERGLRIRVAGHGPLEAAVREDPHVEFVGAVEGEAVGRFLAGCDLGLIPSLWEEPGLTYVVYEWHAAGRPVLATRRGGLAEAAALGGVQSFDGTADGLVSGVERLQRLEAWDRLVAAVPRPTGQRETDAWVDRHLAAYALAAP